MNKLDTKKNVAFVAHSFAPEDAAVVESVLDTIRRAKISVLSGIRPDTKRIGEKIKDRIDKADLLIAIMTHRHRINNDQFWTTSPWVVEEKGYSLGQNQRRPIVILVEEGIPVPAETGGLEGDLEIIFFNRKQFDVAQEKLREVLVLFR